MLLNRTRGLSRKGPFNMFYIVEWYYPDRVLKQFCRFQEFQTDLRGNYSQELLGSKRKDLRKIDLRGNYSDRWDHKQREFVDAWNGRLDRLVALDGEGDLRYSSWYASSSRPTISRTGTMLNHLVSDLHKLSSVTILVIHILINYRLF